MSIVTVRGIFITPKKHLLLMCVDDVWILPGGVLDPQNTDRKCLLQKMKSCMPHASIFIGDLYNVFLDMSDGLNEEIKEIVYFVQIKGDLSVSQTVGVKEVKYFSREDLISLHCSVPTKKIINHLIKKDFL